MLLEEDDQVADVLVLRPGFLDLPSLTSPTPSTSRIRSGSPEMTSIVFAEFLDDPLGQHGPDALDQPGGQEFLDAL